MIFTYYVYKPEQFSRIKYDTFITDVTESPDTKTVLTFYKTSVLCFLRVRDVLYDV